MKQFKKKINNYKNYNFKIIKKNFFHSIINNKNVIINN